MNKIELFEVIGLGRSGHHALMNWILNNLVGFQVEWKYKFTRLADTNFFVLDEGSHNVDLSFTYLKQNLDKISSLMVGYEECDWDFCLFSKFHKFVGPNSVFPVLDRGFDYKRRIVIIRDFFNILASRIKKNEELKNNVFNVEHGFIEMWKNHARACVQNKVDFIKFEDWTSNDKIRSEFLENKLNVKEIFSSEKIKGTNSSFGSINNLHNRYNQVEIPDDIKKIINKDNELFYLIGALGYDFKKI